MSPHKMFGGVANTWRLDCPRSDWSTRVESPLQSRWNTSLTLHPLHHRFLSDRLNVYGGGTPNVVGIVRTGLTFLLKRNTEQRYLLLQAGSNLPPTFADLEYNTYRQSRKDLARACSLNLSSLEMPHRILPTYQSFHFLFVVEGGFCTTTMSAHS
jgi:hypothetical protein